MKQIFNKKIEVNLVTAVLIAATLQFFVPLLNAAVSDQCCESQKMQCCQVEFPSRMVCCQSDANKSLDDSAATQGVLQKLKKAPKSHIPVFASATDTLHLTTLEYIEQRSPVVFNFKEDKIHKKISLLLI